MLRSRDSSLPRPSSPLRPPPIQPRREAIKSPIKCAEACPFITPRPLRRAGPLQFAEICETHCPTSTPLSSWPPLPKKFATDDCASHSNARCHWDGDIVRQVRPLAPSLTLVHKLGFGEDPKKGKVVAWGEWALYGKPILIKVSLGSSLPPSRSRTHCGTLNGKLQLERK